MATCRSPQSREGQQFLHSRRRIQGFVGIENANLCRKSLPQFLHALVILIPVAADSFLAVLCFVLGIRPRPQRVVVPAGSGLLGPVVGRQRKAVIEPFAEADYDFLPRPPQADDANVRLGGNRGFQIGKVEGGNVAQDPRRGRFGETERIVRRQPRAAVGRAPKAKAAALRRKIVSQAAG